MEKLVCEAKRKCDAGFADLPGWNSRPGERIMLSSGQDQLVF